MASPEGDHRQLEQEIEALRRELDELTRSLPRHSVRAAQVLRIEALEDAIAEKQAALRALTGREASEE